MISSKRLCEDLEHACTRWTNAVLVRPCVLILGFREQCDALSSHHHRIRLVSCFDELSLLGSCGEGEGKVLAVSSGPMSLEG